MSVTATVNAISFISSSPQNRHDADLEVSALPQAQCAIEPAPKAIAPGARGETRGWVPLPGALNSASAPSLRPRK